MTDNEFAIRLLYSTYSKLLDDRLALIFTLKELIKVCEAAIKAAEKEDL